MHDDRELDALLDRALANYVDEEPDGALRARITARLAEAHPRQYRMWLFGAIATCAAAVLLAFLMHPAAHTPIPQTPTGPSIAAVPNSPVVGTVSLHENVRPRAVQTARRTHRSERPDLVRPGSFSAPSPLTAEESALLKFAVDHPEQARQLLMSTASDNAPLETKEISISPIHIAALAGPEPQRSED